MKYFCKSKTGIRHVQEGKMCEDASVVRICADHTMVAVIADGIGSCKCSKIGAEIAVQSFADYVVHAYPYQEDAELMKNLLFTAAAAACRVVEERARKDGMNATEYDCTLHAVIFSENTRKAYLFHAGDGMIVTISVYGEFETTSVKKHTGPGWNSVFPLASGIDTWEFEERSDIAAVILATDGLRTVLQPEDLLKHVGKPIYPAAVLPLIDGRCHKNAAEQERFQERFVNGEIDNLAVLACMERLIAFSYLDDEERTRRLDIMRQRIVVAQKLRRVTDDKTLIVLDAGCEEVLYPIEVYREPDWKLLCKIAQ